MVQAQELEMGTGVGGTGVAVGRGMARYRILVLQPPFDVLSISMLCMLFSELWLYFYGEKKERKKERKAGLIR
jgi:hypothetical protein